ncbi:hypothetical protein GCM10009347_37780 [Shewanella algicola]|uniref:Uncharacterized protein n=1 Tax=Shewanella algicola TaxID=640633 RepID=A0A9X1Z6W8_9GAMM|nr:hypothetical protein [Shewanella algicola]MCL1107446.1 hypothetical protein [Shewanella algicola]GGP68857.1 hypothetical protein GCM10009347_37780 [Shewanella algicola]
MERFLMKEIYLKSDLIKVANGFLYQDGKIKSFFNGRISIEELNNIVVSSCFSEINYIAFKELSNASLVVEIYFMYIKKILNEGNLNNLNQYESLSLSIGVELERTIVGHILHPYQYSYFPIINGIFNLYLSQCKLSKKSSNNMFK